VFRFVLTTWPPKFTRLDAALLAGEAEVDHVGDERPFSFARIAGEQQQPAEILEVVVRSDTTSGAPLAPGGTPYFNVPLTLGSHR